MRSKKILVIDDEEDFCRSLKKALERKKTFRVLTATRGIEGIRLAKTVKPDVILLDIMMPDMSGTSVAEELRDNPVACDIPIIFVTAIVSKDEIKESGGVSGGHCFIAKPVILEDLIQKINDVTFN